MRTMSKPKTRKELANELGIHPKTLLQWLKKKNIKITTGLLSPAEQRRIKIAFGYLPASE